MYKFPGRFSSQFTAINFCLSIAMLAWSCQTPADSSDLEGGSKPPNIIFILGDDIGWSEFGFNNERKKFTPNIDRLHENGLSLTQFYVHAVCAPSRSAFLTGRYPFRNWTDWRTEDFGKPSYLAMLGLSLSQNEAGEETRRIHALPTEERTVAEALQEVGYHTALIGKWGCGEWLPEHLPMAQGFDHQYGHYAWGIDYNNYTIPHNAPARFAVYDWHRNQQPLYEQGYATDLIANETVRLLAEHRKLFGERPFFYYIPFNAIHGPLEDIPRHTEDLPRRYAALKCFDEAVGRIMSAVDQYGFSNETLIILSNDNGAIRDTMNAPYRGTKNTNYEGGVRVPCIFHWPGKIKANSQHDALTHITDLYPTIIALAGGSSDQEFHLDGFDLSNIIFGNGEGEREEIVFEVTQSVRPPSIRQGKYKLIGKELFDLEADPSERNNIAAQRPEIVDRLQERLVEISQERPSMPSFDRLMTPALPWVYGRDENLQVSAWVKALVSKIRATQPQNWAPGTTPWPQAPKDGKIIYTGDGR